MQASEDGERRMKRALVTGGAGFLGSHLCERLLEDGCEVVAFDNLYTGAKANIEAFSGDPRFVFVEGDVIELVGPFEKPEFEPLRRPFDEIYNLACPASPVHYQSRPLFTAKTSIFGVLNCIELARRDGAKLLHTSTSEVYGDALVHPQEEHYWGNVNPIGIRSCYDEGKRVAETLIADSIREYDVDARMVRIFNTYGPRMHPQDGRVVSNFIMQALRDEDITIYGDGSQTRSFQYCDDLVEAFRRYMELPKGAVRKFAAEHRLGAPVINTGNPGEYTIRELAEKTIELVNASQERPTASKVVYRPLPGDDPKQRRPDNSLAHELLGWTPKVPLVEGLVKTISYFRSKI